MYLTLCMILFLYMLFIASYSMLYMSSPLSLAVVFMLAACISVYYFYVFLGDFMSYMLFLVYVGGLLVLLIYMIMVSTNYFVKGTPTNLIFLFLMGTGMISSVTVSLWGATLTEKTLTSSGALSLIPGSLALLGVMLLYVFLMVCNAINVGGRSLDLGV